MTNKQRFNRKIIAILVFLIGMLILFGCKTHKAACPTYISSVKGKELKKKSAYNAWYSDFCKVKKKKHKSNEK